MSTIDRTDAEVSGWAVGLAAFAGAIMVLIGIFQAFAGLAAIFEDDFFVVAPNYIYDVDVTAFGWIHLILGVILVFAGISIYSGAIWARSVGVLLAILSAVANFFFIPYYPVWSVLIIALCVAVIWALVTYGPERGEVQLVAVPEEDQRVVEEQRQRCECAGDVGKGGGPENLVHALLLAGAHDSELPQLRGGAA